MRLGNNISAIRGHFGLSQRDFAEKMGVSKAIVSLWENEKKYPSRKNIEKMVSVFKIDPKDLFEPDLGQILNPQHQFRFLPNVHLIKEGVELHVSQEKLSKNEMDEVEKAVGVLKVLFPQK